MWSPKVGQQWTVLPPQQLPTREAPRAGAPWGRRGPGKQEGPAGPLGPGRSAGLPRGRSSGRSPASRPPQTGPTPLPPPPPPPPRPRGPTRRSCSTAGCRRPGQAPRASRYPSRRRCCCRQCCRRGLPSAAAAAAAAAAAPARGASTAPALPACLPQSGARHRGWAPPLRSRPPRFRPPSCCSRPRSRPRSPPGPQSPARRRPPWRWARRRRPRRTGAVTGGRRGGVCRLRASPGAAREGAVADVGHPITSVQQDGQARAKGRAHGVDCHTPQGADCRGAQTRSLGEEQ